VASQFNWTHQPLAASTTNSEFRRPGCHPAARILLAMPRSLIQVLGEMLTGVTRSASYPSSHADPSLIQRLHGLSPDAFEEWTADRFRELGYAVHRTGRSGDHGIDLVATRWGEVAIVQCKRYTNAAVGEEVVGRLYGSMVDRRADRAFWSPQPGCPGLRHDGSDQSRSKSGMWTNCSQDGRDRSLGCLIHG
jgi:HJR/Mrr/RecB family endonuclease